ncbi:MAG: serine/threonine protein kinase, partial [Collinsella sp.]
FQTADELRQVLNSYLSGRAVNVSEPTRIIGAAGDLGATKTRELSDSTRAMVRPVSGVSGQNTARSAVSGSTGSYEVEKPKSNKNKIIAAVSPQSPLLALWQAFATGLFGASRLRSPMLNKDHRPLSSRSKRSALRSEPSTKATTTMSTRAAEQTPTATPKPKGTKVNLVIPRAPSPPRRLRFRSSLA